MNLQEQGFRLMCRGTRDFQWVHPADIQPGHLDCTDMSDTEFEQLVASHYRCAEESAPRSL